MGQFTIECQCAGKPLSPGQNGCQPLVSRAKFPIFMYMTNSSGQPNSIPAGTVLDQTYVQGKLDAIETNPADAWFIFPEMYNLAAPPAENETEDRDGIPVPTGEEIKQPITWEHSKEDANPALKAAYDSLKCNEIGVIWATYSGQLEGMNDGNGNLIPMKLQGETLSAQVGSPVKGTLNKIMVSMLMDELENEANRDYIDSSSIAYPVKNWFSLAVLEVIPYEISNATQTTIVFRANALYGGVDFKKPITGLVTADLSPDLGVTTGEVYNNTTASNVAATLAESSSTPGLYELTLIAAQTAADEIWINFFKSGYSMRTFKVTLD